MSNKYSQEQIFEKLRAKNFSIISEKADKEGNVTFRCPLGHENVKKLSTLYAQLNRGVVPCRSCPSVSAAQTFGQRAVVLPETSIDRRTQRFSPSPELIPIIQSTLIQSMVGLSDNFLFYLMLL
jgi:hypothetical protein